MKVWRLWALLSFSAMLVLGCGGGHGHPATGKLYVTVTNATGSSILRFDNALTATGNIAPGAIISGATTTLSSPGEVALDMSNNRLYVANTGASSVVEYDSISTVSGNTAPTRSLSGASTTLASPVAVVVDTVKDLLYVADSGNILVFSPASTVTGNIAPARTISLGFTATALYADAASDRLYVADGAGNAIGVYDSASTLTGAVSANRTIVGASTVLSYPAGLALESTGDLIVTNASGASISTFASAATANGNVAPVGTVAGASTTLSAPQQAALDFSANLYLGDGGAGEIAIFNSIASAGGNVAPNRAISGSNTMLAPAGALSVRGVALDFTR